MEILLAIVKFTWSYPLRYFPKIIFCLILAICLPISASACGNGREMAAAYFGADKLYPDADLRFRCKMLMLGHMMCVGQKTLTQRNNFEYVLLALHDAWHGSDKRLRCAAGVVYGEHLGYKSANGLSQRPSINTKEWDDLAAKFGTMCKDSPLGSSPDYSDLPFNPPGRKLLPCLSQ